MTPALVALLAPLFGDDVSVRNLRVLTGGASRTTYAFDAVTGTGSHALILRTAPPAEHYAGLELEAAAQAAAADAGAPVPRILIASDSTSPLGDPFLLCEEVAGETIVRRIQRGLDDTGRGRLLEQCAGALAAIHRASTDAPGLAELDQLAQYRGRLDEMGDTTATFEWAFRWLAQHRPAASAPVLVHGDFRMGNLIVDGSDLKAVLDWELVHVGEIYEDLAWFCVRAWRFGAPAELAAGGLGSIDDFLAGYRRAGGAAVDRETLHWWQVLATLKWGVICRVQAERHLSGETPSVELAAIGRRVCENEWDILDLLSGPTMPPTEPPPVPPRPLPERDIRGGLHGRPTAAELVAAVAGFLDGEVRAGTTGAVNFHALVAANALRIVERELLDDTAAEPLAALRRLGYPSEA
ncbi:MAG: phosphotransferase, partial [Mycobacterium sp.]